MQLQDKILKRATLEKIDFSLIKAIYDKPSTNIILNEKKSDLQIRKRQDFPLSPLLFNKVLEAQYETKRSEEEIGDIQIKKKKSILSHLQRV